MAPMTLVMPMIALLLESEWEGEPGGKGPDRGGGRQSLLPPHGGGGQLVESPQLD
jgi:hypothetical protein